MYQTIVSPLTKKINYSLLQKFIEVCQDSYLSSDQTKIREIKEIIEGAGLVEADTKKAQQIASGKIPLTE